MGLICALAAGVGIGAHLWRSGASGSADSSGQGGSKVLLTVDPAESSVQIDHIPCSKREVILEGRQPHLFNVAAPGRLTRRFSVEAKPNLRLAVRLSHTLPIPSPLDPPPTAEELAAGYPDVVHTSAEVDGAFDKLDRYAQCLAMVGDTAESDKNAAARVRLRPDDLGRCKELARQARSLPPALPALESAADRYLDSLQAGNKLDAVGHAFAALRGEVLAVRAEWQSYELALQEKTDGRKAAWHMRQLALAAQSWLRAIQADPPVQAVADARAAAFDQASAAFLSYAEEARAEMARITGANDFMKAADEMRNAVHSPAGSKHSEFAALGACRKLFAAFNAAVVE